MSQKIDVLRGWQGVPGWLAPEEAAVLEAAVLSTAPGTSIVELGRWCGRSLVALGAARSGQALGEKRRPIVSFDSYPETSQAGTAATKDMPEITPPLARKIAGEAVAAFGLEDCWFYYDDAVAGASRYGSAKFKALVGDHEIGLIYIDDDHSGSRVVAEIKAWEPYMAAECEVCIHDFFHEPYGIEAAVDRFMLDHPEWVRVESQLSMMRLRRRWKPIARSQAVPAKVLSCQDSLFVSGARGTASTPPLISVLYNTWRLGGLDCLKMGLDQQTCDPHLFEVVIVDALYPYRRDAVADLFGHAKYRVVHVNPTKNPFPRDHGNLARNDAIRAASGRVCVWWCDYSIAEPESLERHYQKVERSGFRASSCGHIVYGHIDAGGLHPAFSAALPIRTIDDYVDLVEALPSDSPLWTTIFGAAPRYLGRSGLIRVQQGHAQTYEMREKVRVSSIYAGIPGFSSPIGADVRASCLNGPAPINDLYYAKNEATAHDVLVAINGWEESFDDGHASDDMDVSRRLAMAGSASIIDNGNECFVPNPRPFFPLMRWKRTPRENHDLYNAIGGIGRPRAIQGLVNELDQIPKSAPTRAEVLA